MGLFSKLLGKGASSDDSPVKVAFQLFHAFEEETKACVESSSNILENINKDMLLYELYSYNAGLLTSGQKAYSHLIIEKPENTETLTKPIVERIVEAGKACGQDGAVYAVYIMHPDQVDQILNGRINYLLEKGECAPRNYGDFASINYDSNVKLFTDACSRLMRTRKLGEYGNY